MLLATGYLKDFKACFGCVRRLARKGICIDPESAELLQVSVGDKLLVVQR
jgi:hypothetical protein